MIDNDELLSAALSYVKRNWRVFPLRPGGKGPLIKEWQNLATTKLSVIEAWWEQWPNANIGIATGPETGTFVLDIDSEKGGDDSLFCLTEEHNRLPDTVESLTGGGGRHMFFKYPGDGVVIRNSAAKLGVGLDIRGDGGYIVAPPSIHPNGNRYEWEGNSHPNEAPIAQAPQWLIELICEPPRQTQAPAENAGKIPEGQRNSHLTSLGGAMRRKGFTHAAIEAALLVQNQICAPPLADREVKGIVNSISRYAPAKQPQNTPQTITARHLMAKTLPEVRFVIPDLLPEGVSVLGGKPKMGKSWAAMHMGIGVAAGGVILSYKPVEKGRVLYLALEDNRRRLKKRLGILLGNEPAPDALEFQTEWPRVGEGGIEALDSWLREHSDARLVIVDTLKRLKPSRKKNGNVYDEDYESAAAFKGLADTYQVAILLIYHLRKAPADDPLEEISGSLGLTGACDGVLVLKRERGAADASLFVTGRDIEEEQDLALKWTQQTATWHVLGGAEEYRRSEVRRDILNALQDSGPLNAKEIAFKTNRPYDTIRQRLWHMEKDGEVGKKGNEYIAVTS